MPNPLFLKVMGTKLWEYNSLTPVQKEEFQKEATKRLGELHEKDIKAYTQVTDAIEKGDY